MSLRESLSRAIDAISSKVNGGPFTSTNLTVPWFSADGEMQGWEAVQRVLGQTPAELYRTQPHLRTVVSFLARNIAQLGLPVYELKDDGDRQRTRTDVAALLLGNPNKTMTRYELILALVSDLVLYDEAYWYLERDDTPSGWTLTPLRTAWKIGVRGGTVWGPATYLFQAPNTVQTEIPAAKIIAFAGWDPVLAASGWSTAATLRDILAEQVSAQIYRNQRWRRGGRVGQVITRPAGHSWSEEAEQRFMDAWRSKYTGDEGTEAGGTPILQDGMTMQKVGFSAKEDEYIEGTKLALTTVARIFHVNPTMIGVLDNANYSNVREFRRMLYGDTLGPILAQIEGRINQFLLPVIESVGTYVEFNIGEKLQGSFEEQAAVSSAAVGAPWMTRNEQRALQNLPALEGGDELVTPLNVLTGGQANPTDSVPPKERVIVRYLERPRLSLATKAAGPSLVSAKTTAAEHELPAKATALLRAFFARQSVVVLSAIGAAVEEYWDDERWDNELGDDLTTLALSSTELIAKAVLGGLGLNPDAYNVDQTAAFLSAVGISRAGMINATTKAAIQTSIDATAEMNEPDPAEIFTAAAGERADVAGVTLATTFSGFATTEAVKQASGETATKTWVVTSGNPRPEHAAMDGETVGIDEKFSNGADWPGDPVLGAEGVANCECDVVVSSG